MQMDWQTIITGMLITWAAGYIAWRGWRMIVQKKAGGCGTCAKCPSGSKEPENLIQIESMLGPSQKKV